MKAGSLASRNTAAIACCGAAIASLVPIAFYQFKLIRHLPDPPGSLFDSQRITTSKMAFPFGIPDSALGLLSYGTTLALLIADAKSKPILHKVVQAKLLVDGGMAATNTVRQFVRFVPGAWEQCSARRACFTVRTEATNEERGKR